ncbi:MAG: serine hydrolase, partial [Anaerolineae bacterium]|nr:serine hydrolase [Anaerolineae bacterium]
MSHENGRRVPRLALIGLILTAGLFLILGSVGTRPVHGQDQPVVTAEAMGSANLRAGPGTEYGIVGEITKGTAYPVIGRHARFPWLLLQLPDRQGWVFRDLVTITGNVDSAPLSDVVLDTTPAAPPATVVIVPFGTQTPDLTLLPQATLSGPATTPTPSTLSPAAGTPTPSPSPSPSPTATVQPTATRPLAVYVEAKEIANVRYGPGTDFPRIGEIRAGNLYAALRRHTSFPWIEISYADVAGGRGWVYLETVNIQGDVNSLEATDQRAFGYPTLTPTPAMVVTAAAPWPVTVQPDRAPAGLEALSNEIYDMLLAAGFEARTSKQASVFVMDLASGVSFSLNPDVAYSGVSMNKIPVLVALFRKLVNPPDSEQAQRLAEMIICSENLSSNALLRVIGDGDEYRGALAVTDAMQKLGLENTFLARSFFTGATALGPPPTEQPFVPVTIPADQSQTEPDPSNQTTPADMGWLLAGIYACAENGDGPLVETFPDEITQNECRLMMRVLSANKIGAMIEGGAPNTDDVIVAHKHGWSDDTHGDAGIVFTPGGDFVLSIAMHNRTWLLQSES